jgi:hypothetical protein
MPEEFLVPIEVTETRESFVVVRLRADCFADAERAARKAVRSMIDRGDFYRIVTYDTFSCAEPTYEAGEVAAVDGRVEDYNVDIDMIEEMGNGTRAT